MRKCRNSLALSFIALLIKYMTDTITITVPDKNQKMLSFTVCHRNITFVPSQLLEIYLSLNEMRHWSNKYALLPWLWIYQL